MKAKAFNRLNTAIQLAITLIRRYKYLKFNVQNHLYIKTLAYFPF
jgi:hypothetical protein